MLAWDDMLKIHFIHDVSHLLACRCWVVYRAAGSVVGVYVWSRYRIAGFRNYGMESVSGQVNTKKVGQKVKREGGEKQQVETLGEENQGWFSGHIDAN